MELWVLLLTVGFIAGYFNMVRLREVATKNNVALFASPPVDKRSEQAFIVSG